jgi:aminotransferase
MEKPDYRICTRCVMDTSDKYISFDEYGVCNHCYEYDKIVKPYILSNEEKKERLDKLILEIKKEGKGKKYDCIAGLSGGMDSSYVIYVARKYNLRTLIVHFDNGWDSELAIKNIDNIINKTGFDYYNYVVNWEEFKDLQLSYFKSSVVDVEIPTDMGIFSLVPKVALRYNIKFILYGTNIETEFTMGKGWNYTKMDRSNLNAIQKKFGTKKLRSFPYYRPLEQLRFKVKGFQQINVLEFEECNYNIIKDIITHEFGWREYPVKHGESVFTKFYQSYYLPKKFGFDKRRAHLADQINSGHITRERALEILNMPVYSSPEEENREYDYVIKKLGLSNKDFQSFMKAPIKSHFDYPHNEHYGNIFDRIILKISGVKLITSALIRLYRIL